jgi:GNAT superfamily N-acetyltransferase
MFSRIYHFLKGPNPLHPSVWEGRLMTLTFRRLAVADVPGCLELYALNELGRFPEGFVDEYEKTIREPTSYFLVVESEGRIIASCGLLYWVRENVSVFCFGMVRPSHQGKGIGTALLLARLALLNPKRPAYRVLIFAVEKSFGFYQRFGFMNVQPWRDIHGQKHPLGRLDVTSSQVRRCRALLREHEIVVPQDEDQIPFRRGPPIETFHPRCPSCGEIIDPTDDVCQHCGHHMW